MAAMSSCISVFKCNSPPNRELLDIDAKNNIRPCGFNGCELSPLYLLTKGDYRCWWWLPACSVHALNAYNFLSDPSHPTINIAAMDWSGLCLSSHHLSPPTMIYGI